MGNLRNLSWALVFGVLIWASAYNNTTTTREMELIPVEVQVVDEKGNRLDDLEVEYVGGPYVSASFSGPQNKVEAADLRNLRPVVPYTVDPNQSYDSKAVRTVDLRTTHFSQGLDPEIAVTVLTSRPIEFRLVPKDTWPISVEVGELILPEGFEIDGPVRVEPNQVMVRGTRSRLEQLARRTLRTERIDLTGSKKEGTLDRQVRVLLPEDAVGLEIVKPADKKVWCWIPVRQKHAERPLKVPLTIGFFPTKRAGDAGGGTWDPLDFPFRITVTEPDKNPLKVTLVGPEQDLDRLLREAGAVQATVVLRPGEEPLDDEELQRIKDNPEEVVPISLPIEISLRDTADGRIKLAGGGVATVALRLEYVGD